MQLLIAGRSGREAVLPQQISLNADDGGNVDVLVGVDSQDNGLITGTGVSVGPAGLIGVGQAGHGSPVS
jgi:hypothetical protein